MVLYEPVIGRIGLSDIMNCTEIIKFIQNTNFKKEYKKYTTEQKVKMRNGKNKK